MIMKLIYLWRRMTVGFQSFKILKVVYRELLFRVQRPILGIE